MSEHRRRINRLRAMRVIRKRFRRLGYQYGYSSGPPLYLADLNSDGSLTWRAVDLPCPPPVEDTP